MHDEKVISNGWVGAVRLADINAPAHAIEIHKGNLWHLFEQEIEKHLANIVQTK